MNRKIFVALSTFGEYGNAPLKLLAESGFPYVINPLGRRLTREEILEIGGDCEGIIAGVEPYDSHVLDNMPNLRCISRCGVGMDNIDLKKTADRGIIVLNTPDVVVQPVAELTVAMILDLMRRLSYHTSLMRKRIWQKKAGNLISGKKVGVLGLGRIGKRVAEMMIRLDTDVYGTDLLHDFEWSKRSGVKLVSLHELLQISDILTLHLSEKQGKPFLLGEREFARMKKGAVIVNVSRGSFLEEDSLYRALENGHLGGAALDVFPEEPYKGKLCDLENVVMTPHIATLTEESRLQMEIEATNSLLAYMNNRVSVEEN
jgi:D-3-phosphoglycerate dehydrogenase